ncbi:hypothetical protein [Actinomadura coerulea]|uniref:hypothetical protein n=1 Tax=Actinomadura coerulea TaxID=46159 RepID=UPI00343EC117
MTSHGAAGQLEHCGVRGERTRTLWRRGACPGGQSVHHCVDLLADGAAAAEAEEARWPFDKFTWEPQGTPWCRVHYLPDKCAASRPPTNTSSGRRAPTCGALESTSRFYIRDHELGDLLDRRTHDRKKEPIRQRDADVHPEGAGCADTLALLEARANQYATWMTTAQRRRQEVLDLDQVFIAV